MILEYKFSAIGMFESLESTPELMVKLQPIYLKYGLMPNNITMQEISNIGLKTKYRPQLIDIARGVNVDFLPDRIDIIYRGGSISLEEATSKSTEIFEELGSLLDVKPFRFASTIQGIFEGKNETKLFNQENFYQDEKFVEWSARTVHRKDIVLNGINEKLNIVIISEKPENEISVGFGPEVRNYNGAVYTIDINTYLPNNNGTFEFRYFKEFSDHIRSEIEKANDNLKSIYN